jgi:hypothetical protein
MEDVQLSFFKALESVADGKRITKLEWGNKNTYGLLKEDILQLHKNGESEDTLHPWIINNGDLLGEDFVVL